jgi:excinuclease ABC subunit C
MGESDIEPFTIKTPTEKSQRNPRSTKTTPAPVGDLYNGEVSSLRDQAALLPEGPGVYFLKDGRGRVLYIGKARSLRDRVSTYFHPSTQADDPRIERLMRRTRGLETLECATEVEALLAEARLIKDVRPPFNVRLKDDKSFRMLELTADDDFPKLRLVHQTDATAGERFGPFVGSGELQDAVKVMQKIFRFATCSLTIREDDPKRRFFRPCILYNIRRCTAPCAARISKQDYAADIGSLRRFLRGDRGTLLRDLRDRMKAASAALAFERAADLRDQIRSIESLDRRPLKEEYLEGDLTPIDPRECLDDLERRLGVRPRTIEGVDIATVGGAESVGSLVTFRDGAPLKSGYRRYRIRQVEGVDDLAMVREVVGRRFRRLGREGAPMPDVLLIDGGRGQLGAAALALERAGAEVPALLSLAKREELVFRLGRPRPLRWPRRAPALRLLMYVRDEAHRFAQHYHHLLRRKAVLGLC